MLGRGRKFWWSGSWPPCGAALQASPACWDIGSSLVITRHLSIYHLTETRLHLLLRFMERLRSRCEMCGPKLVAGLR